MINCIYFLLLPLINSFILYQYDKVSLYNKPLQLFSIIKLSNNNNNINYLDPENI